MSTDVGRFRIFDRSGHPLSDNVDGFLHYPNRGYLVTFVGNGDVGFQVYRIG